MTDKIRAVLDEQFDTWWKNEGSGWGEEVKKMCLLAFKSGWHANEINRRDRTERTFTGDQVVDSIAVSLKVALEEIFKSENKPKKKTMFDD